MNNGLNKNNKNTFESNEVRIGITSPGPDWIEGDSENLYFQKNRVDYVLRFWQTGTLATTTLNSVAFGNGLFVAVGSGGEISTASASDEFPFLWATQNSGVFNTFSSVAFGNNLWAAGGSSGQLVTSTDAITWTTQTSTFGTTTINMVAFGGGLWVAVGPTGQIRTSTDAITWTTRDGFFGTANILSLKFNNGLWVAGSSGGQLRTSTDGVSWVTQTSQFGTTNITSIEFGNGLWVAAGWSGTLRTSTDAITWTTRDTGFTTNLTVAPFANRMWVVWSGGATKTSTDTITWTTGPLRTNGLSSIISVDRNWLGVGFNGENAMSVSTFFPSINVGNSFKIFKTWYKK